jgi:hypothetical protein
MSVQTRFRDAPTHEPEQAPLRSEGLTPRAMGVKRRARLRAGVGAMLVATLVVAGCATPRAPAGADASEAAAVPAAPDAPQATADLAASAAAHEAAQRELLSGIALYDQGRYVDAIRSLLTSQAIWGAAIGTRVTAQKYVAFSHCLLKRPQPCRDAFKDLLRIKPDFELAAAEEGHPQWSEAFRQAKRDAAAAPAPRPSAQRVEPKGQPPRTVSSNTSP